MADRAKPIDQQTVRMILRLRRTTRLSVAKIARECHVSTFTVKKYLRLNS